MPPKNEESMHENDVKAVVLAVLAEQRRQQVEDLDSVVLKTVATILTSFGIEDDDRLELKADFTHLRKWRRSVETAQGITFKVAITVIVTGFLGAVWLGVKALVGK